MLRYWNGEQWTEHRAPNRQSSPVPAPGPLGPNTEVGRDTRAGSAQPQRDAGARVPLFGARNLARQQREEISHLREQLARYGAMDVAELAAERDQLNAEVNQLRDRLGQERSTLQRDLATLRSQIVLTQEQEILQEVGIYTYRHPLTDSVAYRDRLQQLQSQIKAMTMRDGGAIHAASQWTVNGSTAQGREMVREYSKLMLRAYNAEADNLVRGMKPYKLDSAVDRLDKVAITIERLGKTMSIRVAPEYHRLRVQELELTADFQEMLAREKDRERGERERLREERMAQEEIRRERERLNKERQHHLNALAAVKAKGDHEAILRMEAQLADVDRAIADMDYRAANVKAGYVYVISNIGSFGERMIKIGMTRRLDPQDRIRELSDASVPFNFDVHALFFSPNARDIEAQMHQRLARQRVNNVNLRREFFYATPAEARDLLGSLTGELLQFQDEPEAVEFHQSRNLRDADAEPITPPDSTRA